MRDWNDAFDNSGHVKGSAALPAFWAARAADYRRAHAAFIEEGLAYGAQPRQVFDLVRPDGACKGLVVFVHGGYWMQLDKSYWTDLAEGARARGWAVAMVSYTLTPAARVSAIALEVAAAIAEAGARVAGPVRLMGHSAGGQLVTRMLAAQGPLSRDIADRLALTLSISGVHDLRPLLKTRMNDTLRLSAEEAASESPALLTPSGEPRLVCWVGGAERPEFIRQTRLMALMWDGLGARTSAVVEPGHDHFSVLEGLKNPDSPLVAALLEPSLLEPS